MVLGTLGLGRWRHEKEAVGLVAVEEVDMLLERMASCRLDTSWKKSTTAMWKRSRVEYLEPLSEVDGVLHGNCALGQIEVEEDEASDDEVHGILPAGHVMEAIDNGGVEEDDSGMREAIAPDWWRPAWYLRPGTGNDEDDGILQADHVMEKVGIGAAEEVDSGVHEAIE